MYDDVLEGHVFFLNVSALNKGIICLRGETILAYLIDVWTINDYEDF